MEMGIKTKEIEYALFNKFFGRYPLITTNITGSSGVVNHECDLLMVSKNNYLTEVEIKISKEDLKKDFEKWHGHRDKRIKYQYFAMPYEMRKYIDLIPEEFGIFLIQKDTIRDSFCRKIPIRKTMYKVYEWRKASKNKIFEGYKVSEENLMNLYRLSAMRYWSAKKRELKAEGLYSEIKIQEERK